MSSDRGKVADEPVDGVPSVGALIAGKYRVERVLGHGGMGVVVAARHVHIGQRVAVKFLRPEAARRATSVERFVREARAAVSIQSEHVARVVDVGTMESGAPYLVMEHLTGSDLGEVLASRGPLPIDLAIDYVLQACEAIAEAHALGIVHRDLKPSNLFLTRRADESPLVKVLDFGISKVPPAELDAVGASHPGAHGPRAVAGARLTSTGQVLGSPLYMAPEQIRSARDLDCRADVWSLGVILHELTSARLPFDGESASAICASIAADAPTPLRAHAPEAPEALEAIVLRCLEKDRSRRFSDVGQLAAALAVIASPASRLSVERVMRVVSSTPPAAPERHGELDPERMARGTTTTVEQTDVTHRAFRLDQTRDVADGASAPARARGVQLERDRTGRETDGAWDAGTRGVRRRQVYAVLGLAGAAALVAGYVALGRTLSGAGVSTAAASSSIPPERAGSPASSPPDGANLAPAPATSASTTPAGSAATRPAPRTQAPARVSAPRALPTPPPPAPSTAATAASAAASPPSATPNAPPPIDPLVDRK